ncbi:MAG: response regulator [Bacteroidota bacterium]
MRTDIKILLVEDEEKHANLFFYALEDMGIEAANTHWVTNSADALAAIHEQQFQLAILDIALKESLINGIELSQKIKAIQPHVTVAVFTISRSEMDREAAMAAGADLFLSKPLDFDELLLELNEIFALVK